MALNRNLSFVANLTTRHGNLHVPKLTYGKTTLIKKTEYDPWSFESHVDISNYLCVKKDAPTNQLKFYFDCYDNYYSIYLLTDGFYHGYALSNEDKDFIGAFRPDKEQTTYHLLDAHGRVITLDQLGDQQTTLRIRTLGGRTLSVRGAHSVGGLVCTGKAGGAPLDFKLDVLRRGAI